MPMTPCSLALEKIKCFTCGNLLSVAPISYVQADDFACGRCALSKGTNNTIYEVLAQYYQFSCRYEANGCKERFPINLMKKHEDVCTKKPYLCPIILPKRNCLWRGVSAEVTRHLEIFHQECVLPSNFATLNLDKDTKICKVFSELKTCCLVQITYNKTKGLAFTLLELGVNSCNAATQCEIHFHSPDFTKSVKLHSCCINTASTSRHEVQEYFINSSVLTYLSAKTVLIELIFIKPQTKIDKDILSLLECPVCTEVMLNTIYQCKAGHSFCETCIKQLSSCPICKKELTNTCNYALMTLSAQLYHPCINKERGCLFEDFPDKLRKHEATCYRYECPLKLSNSCNFNGDRDELLAHCTNYHEHLSQDNFGVKWSLKAKNCIIIKIICAYGNVFSSCRKFTGNDLLWTIQFYGEEKEAKGYNFTIEFKQEGKSLIFSDVCSSMTDEARVFENGLCIPYYQLGGFVSNNLCVNNIFITKNVKNK